MAELCSAFILIIGTLFLPPLGVFFVGGCSTDLLINIVLTMLGYFPGHIHAFYCEYVYYDRRARGPAGRLVARPAPCIFSKRIQNGGEVSRDFHHPAPISSFNPTVNGHTPDGSPVQQNWAPAQPLN